MHLTLEECNYSKNVADILREKKTRQKKMEIQIRIKSENEYFCVLMLVCLSITIIVKSKNKTKTCKRSFHIKSRNSTCQNYQFRQ